MIKVPKSFEDALVASIDDIGLPTERKTCSICKQDKLITEFSLKVGKTSDLRKTFCTKCEHAKRKKKPAKWAELLALPCSICGDESVTIHLNGSRSDTALPLGVLCSRCLKFLPNSVGNQELLERVANYIQLSRDFPFWCRSVLEMEMKKKLENETPLLDLIDEN